MVPEFWGNTVQAADLETFVWFRIQVHVRFIPGPDTESLIWKICCDFNFNYMRFPTKSYVI